MEFINEIDNDYQGSQRSDPPFLPDLHLKSACLSDRSISLRRYLTEEGFACHDLDIKKTGDALKRAIPRITNHEYHSITIVSDFDSAKYYPWFWSKLDSKQLPSGISNKLAVRWRTFRRYFDRSKSMMSQFVTESLTTHSDTDMIKTILRNKNVQIKEEIIEKMARDQLGLIRGSKGVDDEDLIQGRNCLELDKSIKSLNIPDDLFRDFCISERLNWLKINMIKKQVSKDKSWSVYSLRCKQDTLLHKDFILVRVEDSIFCLLDTNQLLMLSDTSMSRYLTLLNAELVNQHLPNILPKKNQIQSFYEWGDAVLEKWGNNGYSLLKKIEAICIGVYLKKWDPLKESKNFLSNLTADTESKYLPDLNELIGILTSIETPNELFEIFGLYRHIGHPIIDEELGCEKVKDVTRENIQLDQDSLLECLGASKRSFIIEYIKKNKHWPLLDLEKTEQIIEKEFKGDSYKDDFVQLIRNQFLNYSDYMGKYPLKIWAQVFFKKNFEFNDYEDFTPLLSDTAISPTRDNWTQIYNYSWLKYSLPKDFTYSRRTLINLLKRPEFSMKKIRQVIESGKIPKSWLIVALHSKERELRIHARLFAMMVLEMRMYFAVTEKNISDTLFKYVPTQTMTSSEAELNSKLLSLTNLKNKNKSVSVIFSLDIDKFNHRWRKESTDPFFSTIDDLFGVNNLYTFSHRFFENAFYCLSSYNHPPSYLRKNTLSTEDSPDSLDKEKDKKDFMKKYPNLEGESQTTWQGQAGGCEGLRQKGWTFVITSALLATEEDTGVKSFIIGQGDNQVLVCLFPILQEGVTEEDYIKAHSKTLSRQIFNYQSSLEKYMKGLGMKLKLEETWCSTTLMNYSKEILIKGAFTTGYLKRISRAYSDINEVYPTLSTRISSIYSSCHSSASKFIDPVIPYIVASTLTLDLLDQEIKGDGLSNFQWSNNSLLKRRIDHTDDPILTEGETILFLALNKEVGGYPILPFLEFLYRGHPDPVNTYLAYINNFPIEDKQINKIKQYISEHYKEYQDNPINYQKLIQDPTSLNWVNHSMNTGKISQLLEDNLQRNTVNKDIKILLNTINYKATRDTTTFLMSVKPTVPRVLNEIFRQSPEGAKLGYLSIFSDMKTMKEMMPDHDSRSLIKYIEESENRWIEFTMNLIFKIDRITPNLPLLMKRWDNTYLLSLEITNYLWDLNIEGSRIPHPLDQFKLTPLYNDICIWCNKTINLSDEFVSLHMKVSTKNDQSPNSPKEIRPNRDDKRTLYLARGNFTPYMGSSTREKRSKSLINFPKGDKALLGAQNLFRIKDWVVAPGGYLDQYLSDLIQSRTEIPFHIIQLAAGKYYGGSVIHRFNDVVTKHSCRPNCRPNFFSHFYISSDTMGRYSGGKDNYNLHYQSIYLCSLSLASIQHFWLPRKPTNNYHFHVIREKSIPLSDLPPMDTDLKSPSIKELRGSRLLFSTISEYVDKSIDFQFDKDKLIDPNITSNISKERALLSAALIIYTYLTDRSTPLISTDLEKQEIDITDISLTIDDLKVLSLKDIFQYVGRLWLMDNLRYVLSYAERNKLDIEVTITGLIYKIPNNAFSFMRAMLCNSTLIEDYYSFGWMPTSSNYIVDSSSIEREILGEMAIGAIDLAIKKPLINFIVPYKALSLNRWILIYFQYLIFRGSHESITDLLNELRYFFLNIYNFRDLRGQRSNLEQMIGGYLKWTNKNPKLIKIGKGDIPMISICGPEPWIREYKNKMKKSNEVRPPVKFTNCKDDKGPSGKFLLAIKPLKELIGNMKKLKRVEFYRKDINRVECIDLFTHISSPMELPVREIHQHRLSGLYSTAHYKYAEIFSMVSRPQFYGSINLAEGAGGVSKLCAQWFNCRLVIYNSLLSLETFSPQRAPQYVPPELLYLKQNTNIPIYGIRECINTGGDLSQEHVINVFQALIANHIKGPSIMTMDAELGDKFSPEKSSAIIRGTLKLFNLLQVGSVLILKTFYWYIDYFKHILAILADNYNMVTVYKPTYSSHENTEVFLIITKDVQIPSLTWKKDITIPLDDAYFINQYLKMKPDTPPLSPDLLIKLHGFMEILGFTSNYEHALKVLTGHNIDIERFKNCPLRELSDRIDFLITYIRERAITLYKSSRNLNLSLQERIIKKYNPLESIDLQQTGEYIVNLYILRGLVLDNKFDFNWISNPISILNKPNGDIVLYRITIDPRKWYNVYGRSLNKIIGHNHLLSHNLSRGLTGDKDKNKIENALAKMRLP